MKRRQYFAESRSCLLVDAAKCGFRPRYSAADAILNLAKTIRQAFQSQMGATCVPLDIGGAYDNVSHQTLVTKLHSLNCPSQTLKWITTYLTDRTLQTTHSSEKSDTFWDVKGVLQGSSLSPLLFTIYITDLLIKLNVTPGILAQGYADDIIVTAVCKGCRCIQRRSVQRGLAVADNWAAANSMRFSLPKAELVHFSSSRVHGFALPITYQGHIIRVVDSLRYLRVFFDKKLTWDQQIRKVVQNASHKLSCMKSVCRRFWEISR